MYYVRSGFIRNVAVSRELSKKEAITAALYAKAKLAAQRG